MIFLIVSLSVLGLQDTKVRLSDFNVSLPH